MSLDRIKTLYCIAVIAIAVVLDCTGGVIGWTAAVVVLIGALPVFRLICHAGTQVSLDKSESTLDLVLNETGDHPSTL